MQTLIRLTAFACLFFFSCHRPEVPLADSHFTDSLISLKAPSRQATLVEEELAFWKKRVDSMPGAYTPLSRYAGSLVQRFHLSGNMNDLLQADSIYQRLNRDYQGKEAGLLRSMASLAITRHRFREADSLVQLALAIGSEKYSSVLLSFDTQFELGSYTLAERALNSCVSTNEYGYFFRLARWKHWLGETDSAVSYMQKAADWSGNSVYLRQTALSNMADLYQHEGRLKEAADVYTRILHQNPSDYHSLRGLTRIMLVHDRNIAGSEKIFRHIAQKNALPDPLYDLVWVAEMQKDSLLQKKYAQNFAARAGDSIYGSMYDKYLIELYTGILHQPGNAVLLAEQEVAGRSTPQTYAWLSWALFCNGEKDKAMQVYKTFVSGKPLEALELYWMGKMMKASGKNYNASEFFKAAARNRYDLSPLKQLDLDAQL